MFRSPNQRECPSKTACWLMYGRHQCSKSLRDRTATTGAWANPAGGYARSQSPGARLRDPGTFHRAKSHARTRTQSQLLERLPPRQKNAARYGRLTAGLPISTPMTPIRSTPTCHLSWQNSGICRARKAIGLMPGSKRLKTRSDHQHSGPMGHKHARRCCWSFSV